MKQKLTKILIILVLITLLVPISSARAQWLYEDGAKYGGTYIEGFIASEPNHLNPITTTVSNTHSVVPNIFNSLVFADEDWVIHPNLALDWEISSDGTEYTFYLVQNAKWHDGEPFTAADVEFTVNKGWKNVTVCPYSPSIFGYLDRAEAIDDYTVKLYLSAPFAPILLYLSTTLYGAIIPKHIYDGTDILTNPANMEPIGTGPFMFKEWVHGDHITVVRNPNYFKEGLPYLNTVIHKIITDQISMINAMETGEIDGVGVIPQQVELWEDDPRFYLVTKRSTAQAGMYIIQFNMNETAHPIVGGFSEEATKVRKALHYATDVDFIIDQIFFGLVIKGTSPFPSTIWGHKNVAESDPREYDIDTANALLDEAGYPVQDDGWRFELYTPYITGGVEQQIVEYLRENWKKVYVKLNLEGMDRPPRLGKWGRGEFDVLYDGPYHGPDASVTTGRFYMSSNIRYFPYTNCQQYINEDIDEAFIKAQTTIDEVERQEWYDFIQETLWDDCTTIWIGAKVIVDAFSVDFPGEAIQPFGNDDTLETLWWTGGSSHTPEDVGQLISDAEARIDSLAGQFYNVGNARDKLDEAKTAYQSSDWALAATLVEEATTLVSPPYTLYGIVVAVIAIVLGGVIWYRRRETPQF
jgi:peptide/nickel transport system substrate-binding protein